VFAITVIIATAMCVSYLVICFATKMGLPISSRMWLLSLMFGNGRFGEGDHGVDGFGGGGDRGDKNVIGRGDFVEMIGQEVVLQR
jgi:hypothetical protein